MNERKAGFGRRATVVAVGAAALLGAAATGAGTASAQDSWGAEIASCQGMSPNVIDMPVINDMHVSGEAANPGMADVSVSVSGTVWGYRTHPTITWTNLATGTSGVLAGQSSNVSMFGSMGVSYPDVPTGAGPVRFDLSVENDGWFPVPPITCSGTVDVV